MLGDRDQIGDTATSHTRQKPTLDWTPNINPVLLFTVGAVKRCNAHLQSTSQSEDSLILTLKRHRENGTEAGFASACNQKHPIVLSDYLHNHAKKPA